MTTIDPSAYDPKPEPPSPGDYDACCGSGCDPCIFDLYDQAVDRYRKALQAWHERHPEASADATGAPGPVGAASGTQAAG